MTNNKPEIIYREPLRFAVQSKNDGDKWIHSEVTLQASEIKNCSIERIIYRNNDTSPNVEGIIAKPHNAGEKSLPLVIYNTPGVNHFCKSNTSSTISGIVIPYSTSGNGCIVAVSSLRDFGNDIDGYGATNNHKDQYGGSDIQDILDIIEIGKMQPEWDGRNVIMVGFSRGAMMTYLAIKEGAKLTGAVIVAGEASLLKGEQERERADGHAGVRNQNDVMIPDLKGKEGKEREEILKSRSAIYWPEKLMDTPLLIIHGEKDTAVNVSHAVSVNKALDEIGGKNHTLKIYPEYGHSILHKPNVERDILKWCNLEPKKQPTFPEKTTWVDRTASENPRYGYNKTPNGSKEI